MKCESKKCDAEAVFTVYWPGSTVKQCPDCCNRSVRTADALGFNVDYSAIEQDEYRERGGDIWKQ